MDRWDSSLNIANLRLDYEAGILPSTVITSIFERIEHYASRQSCVFIHVEPLSTVLSAANSLLHRWPDPSSRPPLWGIPFSVKDNIDVAHVPTTNACPGLASTPHVSAPVVQRCLDAGALFIGKTNMEQFATGITGCRSPYGTLHSVFSPAHVVGGSSSGSAVSVAEGLVSFSLGTDTAASIRVPAVFNGIVGFKPTKGMISARGVTPMVASMDTVGILTLTVSDAKEVWAVVEAYDAEDVFAKNAAQRLPLYRVGQLHQPARDHSTPQAVRIRFGMPPAEKLALFSAPYRRRFHHILSHLSRTVGAEQIPLDWTPFAEADRLLREGTLNLERSTTLMRGWVDKHEGELLPVIAKLLRERFLRREEPMKIFEDLHRQRAVVRAVEEVLTYTTSAPSSTATSTSISTSTSTDTSTAAAAVAHDHDDTDADVISILILPTTTHHPTLTSFHADPLAANSLLASEFAFFGNVLDLCGVAVPCGTYVERESGRDVELPFGVTIWAGRGLDGDLLGLCEGLEEGWREVEVEVEVEDMK